MFGATQSIQGGWRHNLWGNYPQGTLQRFQRPLKIKLPEVVEIRAQDANREKKMQKDFVSDTYKRVETQARDIDHEGHPN